MMIVGAGGAVCLAGVIAAQMIAPESPEVVGRSRQYKVELAENVACNSEVIVRQLQGEG